MAISFNTSTFADSGGSAAASTNITIPAGVLAGDIVLLVCEGINIAGTTTPGFSVTTTGTAWSQLGTTQSIVNGGFGNSVAVFYIRAVAGDIGLAVTVNSTGVNSFMGLVLAAYTGAGASQPDVIGGTATAAVSSVTLPTVSTGVSGDWAVYLCGTTDESNILNGPAGATSRVNHLSASAVGGAIFDSNGSVGAAGTSIGGGTFSASSTSSWWGAFTVGLAPPGSIGGAVAALALSAPAGTVRQGAGASGPATAVALAAPAGSVGTASLSVTTTALANVAQNVGIRRWLSATGGTAPYSWSVLSGTLPAGITLTSDGKLSGAATGTGTSSPTFKVTDAAAGTATATLSITSVSAPLSPSSPVTDGNGVITWSVTSLINGNDAESIRILQPTSPSADYAHGLLITLPVAAGTDDTSFGNGLDTCRLLGAHNTFNLTVIEPSTGGNWLADNPSNANLLQESYMLQVVAWAKANYATSGSEKVYLIGLSRTGIGGQGLFLHWPDVYQAVASWDFPAQMTSFNGADPNGTVGGSPNLSYGTADNFTSNYQLSPANLAKWAAGQNFATVTRMWIGGYFAFQSDVTNYDPILTTASILHYTALVAASAHNWSPTPGWVAGALADIVWPNISGQVAALALTAKAGSVAAGTIAAGPVAALTFAAPAGVVPGNRTIAGAVAAFVLAAAAGTATPNAGVVNATSSPAVTKQVTSAPAVSGG